MVNFLSLLGWSLDDKTEIFSMPELVKHFSIERVSKSPAIFNVEKLDWMNGRYLREISSEQLADALVTYWADSAPHGFDREPDRAALVKVAPLISERMKSLADAAALIRFLFTDDLTYETDSLVQKKMDSNGTLAALERALTVLKQTDPFEASKLEPSLRALAEELELKPGQLFGSLRAATTGQRISPPLFESMELLGKSRTVRSVEEAITRLNSVEADA
jgi:glutamyl-tRNA synthetase